MDYPIRVLCVIFGFIDLIGVFWHQESMSEAKIMLGLMLATCELLVGFMSVSAFLDWKKLYLYMLLCALGVVCALYFIFQALFISYGENWFAVAVRLIILVFFMWFLINAIAIKKHIR